MVPLVHMAAVAVLVANIVAAAAVAVLVANIVAAAVAPVLVSAANFPAAAHTVLVVLAVMDLAARLPLFFLRGMVRFAITRM